MGSNPRGHVGLSALVALLGILGGALVGCASSGPAVTHGKTPASTPAAITHASAGPRTPSPIPTSVPTLDLSGTAKQNFAYFNMVGHALLDHNAAANTSGRTIIDYFVKAGFPKKDMEVTPDKTSIGLAAWNIEFSVKINGGCIIGQAGNVGFNSFVAPVVSTGTCLIGTTRKIDW